MGRIGEWFRGFLPRRRQRSWRYVSPRRHGAGVVVLLALVSGLYAYWHLTNDRRVRQEARQYLCALTGGDWRIDRARFSLFGGIELRGVELREGNQEQPFFRAEKVHLDHHPWGLLARQCLDVREVRCQGATVRLAYDAGRKAWIYPKLRFSAGGQFGGEGPATGPWWPPLVSPQTRVLLTCKLRGLEANYAEAKTDVQGLCRREDYRIALTGDAKDANFSLDGTLLVNMMTGEVVTPSLAMPDLALLQQLGLLGDMGISGRVTLTGRWDPRTGSGCLDANFEGGSLKLAPEFGGLALRAIRGQLGLDPNGVTVRALTGLVAQGGDARFTVRGRYEGYEPNSPFDLRLSVEALRPPQELQASGPVADVLAYVRRNYEVKGLFNVAMRLARDGGGRTTVEGNAVATDVAAMDKSFAYGLEKGQADIGFTESWLEFRHLRGTHAPADGNGRGPPARISVKGIVRFPPEGKTYDLLVEARDVPLDEEVKGALWEEHKQLWNLLSPRGRIGADIRVRLDSPGQTERQDITLLLNKETSIEYSDFPYRLQAVDGDVQLSGGTITLNSITCGAGPQTRCTLEGTIRLDANLAGEANLAIIARLPLDERLSRALGESGEAVFAALRPSGMADNVRARIWKRPGEQVRYHVAAAVGGASFTFDRFPYSVTDANGTLVFEPSGVTISGLRGRHKDTPIRLDGNVAHGPGGVGVDLNLRAESVRVDQELFEAVPPSVQRVWKELSPGGLADVEFALRWKALDDPNALDYACSITARDMQLKWAGFPYPLRGLAGLAVVTPDRVELRDVTASAGRMKLAMDGLLTTGEGGDRAELSLRAEDAPLDSELLAAFPLRSVPLFSRLKPGGSCSLDLRRLVLASGPRAAGAPAAATAPAVPLGGQLREWLLEGEISLKDADIDLGVPSKLTGGLSGRIAGEPGGLRIDANLFLGSLAVNQRLMTEVRGRMWKDPASDLLHIDDIVGKAYGGRMAGFAEVRLGEPLQYGLRIVAENMNLNDVFNASVTDPNQRTPVEGLLDATIEMKATEGNRPVRHISGLLHLSKAKTQKMPVLVDQLQPVLLALPGESGFSEGVVEYTLKEDKVLFREIHLNGPALSIVGSGTMNLKNEALKLTFLGRPGIVPRMDSLAGELIAGVLRELVEIQVGGTLKNPRFKTVPLRSVDAIVTKLLRPEAE